MKPEVELVLYDTLTRSKRPLRPLEDGRVRMYHCGPTVYQRPHIGNYRAFLFADLLRRVVEASGLEVLQVMNLTDVDDKVIKGSTEAGVTIDEFTEPPYDALHAAWAQGDGVFWAVGGEFADPATPNKERAGVVARFGPGLVADAINP